MFCRTITTFFRGYKPHIVVDKNRNPLVPHKKKKEVNYWSNFVLFSLCVSKQSEIDNKQWRYTNLRDKVSSPFKKMLVSVCCKALASWKLSLGNTSLSYAISETTGQPRNFIPLRSYTPVHVCTARNRFSSPNRIHRSAGTYLAPRIYKSRVRCV